MTSLTERYLATVLRALPESKKADVERELRSSIADAIADRIEAGEDPTKAEVAVLEGLGDPTRLAADYAGRPQYLIGPEFFGPYRLLLTRLAGVGIPLAAIVPTIIAIANDKPYLQAILEGIGSGFVVGIQLVFWVTLLFVFIERADAARDSRAEITQRGHWTVANLPDTVRGRVTVSETAGEVFSLVIAIGGLLVLRDFSWLRDASGGPLPILNPGLGDLWLQVVLGLLVALIAVQLLVHFVGRWTLPLAAIYAVVNATFAVAIVKTALNGMLVNRAFAEKIGWPTMADGQSVAMIVTAVSVTVVTAIEILSVVRRALRARGQASQPAGSIGPASAI